MKRRVLFVLLSCMLVMGLTACGHEHTWQEATCKTPKTCAECGETEGEPLEHVWTEATCTTPKTCAECGETEGEPLEHTWTEANYQQAKTCSVCETTEGEPLQSDFEKYGIPCNVVLDQEFDYDNACSHDVTKDAIMKGLFTDYKCFVSDESHEAKEGYVWQTVTLRITVNDYNGWYYGTRPRWSFEGYHNMLAQDESAKLMDEEEQWYLYQFSQNYNGKDYDECLFKVTYDEGWENSEYWDSDYWDEAFPRYSTREIYFDFCVPENSDGLAIVLRNERLTGEYVDHFFNMNNLDSVEAFHLPVATPNQ